MFLESPIINRRSLLTSGVLAAAALCLDGEGEAAVQKRLPARAIGVNCFDLFYRSMGSKGAATAYNRLRPLKHGGIPFVRFSCSPYWPNEWRAAYLSNREKYFDNLDKVVREAEEAQIGLIPTLIWNPVSVSDVVGEPISEWGNPNSKTRAFMAGYISAVVARYRSSSAIWMWEFANEFNSFVDLPNALKWWPVVSPSEGTPAFRTKQDLMTNRVMSSAINGFVSVVRQLDPYRLISSGSDIPRNNAFNLTHGKWDQDSPSEYELALKYVTPAQRSVMSIHLYPDRKGNYFGNRRTSYSDILSHTVKAAQSVGVPTFIGEFGVPASGSLSSDRLEFRLMLDDILASGAQYAALWVYDFPFQANKWDVTFSGPRAYQLAAIANANVHFGLS